MRGCLLVLVLLLTSAWRTRSGEAQFYIYEWPDLVDRYANFTDRSHLSHGVEFPAWITHYGAGRRVDPVQLEHKTSQFGLFKIMFERALIDPRRTMDPSKASSFLIPFDVGMHTCFLENNGRMRRSGCPLAPTVEERLEASEWFTRNHGHDHLMIFAINYNMNYFSGAPKCTSLMRTCWNCTKLAIDEYLFTAKHRDFESKNRGINWHAVPFPSDYHFSNLGTRLMAGEEPPSEQLGSRRSLLGFGGGGAKAGGGGASGGGGKKSHKHKKGHGNKGHDEIEKGDAGIDKAELDETKKAHGGGWVPPWQRVGEKKEVLVSFTGSPRRFNEHSTKIREALVAQCANHTQCVHGHYKHDAKASNNELARKSLFCLQPPGDMPSRKSLFDTILSGCIPVLFHPLTARFMYEWHWSQDLWKEVSVSFDSSDDNHALIDQKQDFIARLIAMAESEQEELRMKQMKIQEFAHQLQYSLVEPVRAGAVPEVARLPGQKDAYDIAMENVLAIHSGHKKHDRVSDYVECMLLPSRGDNVDLQTADWCTSTGSNKDPYPPPSPFNNHLFKGE